MNSFKENNRGEPPLPLVRLGLILPFVDELDHQGVDTDTVLRSNGLVRETVNDPHVYVPPIVIHRFLECAAHAADEPHLGVRVGEQLDLTLWSPLIDAITRATTLVEFLTRFIWSARDEVTSARHSLEVNANHTCFRERRTSEQAIAPAQNDAFMGTFLLSLLRRGAGSSWNPKQVRLTVCDPDALPHRYLGISIIGGDRMGIILRFPTQWLFKAVDQRSFAKDVKQRKPLPHVPIAFLDGLKQILLLNLHETSLGVDLVAQQAGMSRQSLQRKLKARGTTLSAEIIEVKKQRAGELLIETTKSVPEVAAAIGFTDPTSFARAFKSWTGESPSAYRKMRRVQGTEMTSL